MEAPIANDPGHSKIEDENGEEESLHIDVCPASGQRVLFC